MLSCADFFVLEHQLFELGLELVFCDSVGVVLPFQFLEISFDLDEVHLAASIHLLRSPRRFVCI